jgi:hypothetical protein
MSTSKAIALRIRDVAVAIPWTRPNSAAQLVAAVALAVVPLGGRLARRLPLPLPKMQNTEALTRLALDLSWSWNHSADEIWKTLDPELWELTRTRG